MILYIQFIETPHYLCQCSLTYVAKTRDRNAVRNETEKILKYMSLMKKMQRMWNI